MHRSCSLLWVVAMTALALRVQAAAPAAEVTAPAPAVISYVDVAPVAAVRSAQALRRYCDRLRAAGAADTLAVEQRDQPGRFVVLEEWGSDEARGGDAVRTAGQVLQGELQTVRLGSYDERVYRVLVREHGPQQAGSLMPTTETVVVVAHVDIVGRFDGAGQLLADYARMTAGEMGLLRAELWQGQARANHYTLIELWQSADAWAAHRLSVSRRQFREAIEPMTGSPLDERVYTPVR
ncbi:MAG: antibiotic biosynthesis monooxygenase [Steroidobacteraceae bacterium]